jgi:SAM-dependent methyltransferase
MNTPNAEQRKNWNDLSGPKWVALQPRLDAQLAPFTDALLAHIPLRPGARALDVGCGTGATSLALSRAVGPTGRVTGVDLSAVMLDLAAARAAREGVANVRFAQRDAQVEEIPDAPYDLLASRFGVMFFDDPTAAFAHLGAAMAPGAALGFVCWQSAERNAWVRVPREAAMTVLDEVPLAPPGAPGPFGFADEARVRAVLEGAGWRDVTLTAHAEDLVAGGGGDLDAATEFLTAIGPTAGALRDAPPALALRARAAVREALAPFAKGDVVALPSATWIVTARWDR